MPSRTTSTQTLALADLGTVPNRSILVLTLTLKPFMAPRIAGSGRPAYGPSLRILVISDLHFETHYDGGVRLCEILAESFRERRCDLAVVAGDLCTYRILKQSIRLLSRTFPETVYVLGNHECWGSSMWRTLWRARRECERLGNVRLLEDSVTEVGGLRFVGCTMWFRYPPPDGSESEWAMVDFERIAGIRAEVRQTNLMSVRFLGDNVRPGDVVVTHHLPGPSSVHPRWRVRPYSALNKYFVCDVEEVMRRHGPALWIHGHTHDSMDHLVGRTRVLCNPLGYLMTRSGPQVNPAFDPGMVVEI